MAGDLAPDAALIAEYAAVAVSDYGRAVLAAQVRGMLPHCGLTLVMSRQRRAAAAAGERILPGAGPAADNEPRGG